MTPLVFIHNFCYAGARVQTSSPPGRGTLPKLAMGGREASTTHTACGSPRPRASAAARSTAGASAHAPWAERGRALHPSTHQGKGKPARTTSLSGTEWVLAEFPIAPFVVWAKACNDLPDQTVPRALQQLIAMRSYYSPVGELDRNPGPQVATYSVADKHIPWKSPYPLPELSSTTYLLLLFFLLK